MAHRYTPQPAPKTEDPGPDDDSDRDSGVGGDAGVDDDRCDGSSPENDRLDSDDDSIVGTEFTVFVAFKGNMEDEDFTQKLDNILSGIPDILDMGTDRLQPQHVEPWNSVRVTFNIPREAAERLRLLAQNNQQQLRDLGILSVQIEGEGAINVVPGPNRGQEVRVNGPIGGPSQMRMDVGFPGQSGPGVRMANPSMVPPSPGMSGQGIGPGTSGQMHPRVPRPPTQTDMMDPMMPGMSMQPQQQLQHQQSGPHGSGPMPPQAVHHMQALQAGRPLNPAALQQLQQQHHQQQQAQQLSQLGSRPPFNPSGQMAMPPGWNQMPQGTQGGPAWRKPPPQGQMMQRPPSLATVQTPSHPPPPYPFGSQQAGQVFNAMGQAQLQQQAGMGQFATPQPKGPQGGPGGIIGPPRPPPPMPATSGTQGNLTAKSPGSSSSPFQQGSPGTPPMMAQRPTTPQGFPQGVGSPGRAALGQQGGMQQGFMGIQQHGQPGAQVHPGMAKRPMGFPTPNFVQGQVSANTPGASVGGVNPQLQNSQALTHTGSQPPASTSNSVQGLPHTQTNVMGVQSSMTGPPPGTTAGPQMMGLQHQAQPVSSSPSQMAQAQGGGQTVLSRPLNQGQRGGMTPPKQLMPQQGQGVMHGQGQMVGGQGHQAMLLQQQQQQQQNPMMEQMVVSQMQGNKQTFGGKMPPGVMPGQMMRGPSPNVQGNMSQFQGQIQQMTPQQQQQMAQLQQQQLQQQHQLQQHQLQQQQHAQMNQQGQQVTISGNPNQVMGMHGQQMRLPAGHPLIQQQLQQQLQQQKQQQVMLQQQAAQQHPHSLGDPTGSAGEMGVQQMVSDIQTQQQQGMLGGPQHMQMGNGHFAGHGMNFNPQFPGQMQMGGPCGQTGNFPVSKDVTLTSPLLVNLLQSDISASQFGPGGKQGPGGTNQAKPKKKKPPRKKKPKDGDGQQGDGLGGLDAGLDDSELGEQSLGLDNQTKIQEFSNRAAGFSGQSGDQRVLQQVPMQFMQQQQQQLQHMQQQQLQHLQQQQQMHQMQAMAGPQSGLTGAQPGMPGHQQGLTGPHSGMPPQGMPGQQSGLPQQAMPGQQPGITTPQPGMPQQAMPGQQPGMPQQTMPGQQPGIPQQTMPGQQPGITAPPSGMTQQGMPGQQQGMTGPQPGMSGQQQGMQGVQQVMPGQQQGMNVPQQGIAGQQQGMVGLHQGAGGQQATGQPQMHPHQLQQQQAQQQSHLQQQQQQQMIMMMKMQQEQAKNRMSMPPGSHLPPRGMANSPEVQRLPVAQQGNMPVMISLQGPGSVPPSPDKARGMPMMVNPQLAGASRRMSHPDVGQGQATPPEETTAVTQPKQDRPSGLEMAGQPANGAQQMMANQGSNTHMMKQGPSPMQHPGASPQQQLPNQPQQGGTMPGLHFPNVPTTSQSSRPKTPNRASPRPYHPLTPTNRPPSTEPNEINLSPERLNASIAGLFPPKINIPLPPRQPNLNRGFDQQGLNPTTLKAIGQAPPSLALPGNNSNGSASGNASNSGQQSFSSGTSAGTAGAKQDKQSGVQGKRASPSNSRRSSPASSRKPANPSPGRQKGAKMACSPHQQQLLNPQGPTMMMSPSSVPLNSCAIPPQAAGGLEAQPTQPPFSVIQGNSVEAGKDGQGERPLSQPHAMRELTSPRLASPRIPTPQQSKVDIDSPASDRHSQDIDISPALREAPTSLNQLLDNVNVPVRSLQMGRNDGEKPHSNAQSLGQATVPTSSDPRPAVTVLTSSHNLQQAPSSLSSTNVHPSLTTSSNAASTLCVNPNVNINPHATTLSNLNTTTVNNSPNPLTSVHTSAVSTSSVLTSSNPSPGLNKPVHSLIQIPASSSNISPNQITVFVTSNPITSTPSSQPPGSMVAVPNKNLRPQDVRQQGPTTRPQFITTTPLFINPIIQVPGATVTANTTLGSQPVTMVQVSQANIHLTPSSSHSLGTIATSSQSRPIQIPTTAPSSSLIVNPQANQQMSTVPTKQDNLSDNLQKQSPPLQQPSPHAVPPVSSPFQPPMSSPPPCSSPGAVSAIRKSAVSPSAPAQVRPSHIVATQPLNLPTNSPIQIETPATPRTALGQIAAHGQVANQTSQIVPSPDAMTSVGMVNVTTAASMLSTVTVARSSLPSVVSNVAVPKSEGSPAVSSSAANLAPSQSDPLTTKPHASPAVGETSQHLPAPSQDHAQAQETLAMERTGEEVSTGPEQGWAKKRKTPINLVPRAAAVEKPKGPSRRSSRAEKETEEEPVADSGSRKRSARPATSTTVKETGASPTQAKRRKSK